MKRYKLLKDTPTAPAGTIYGTIGFEEHIIMDPYGVEYDVAKIDDFNEWFKEIKEPTDSIHWKPKLGDRCFILENANIRPTLYTGMLRDYNAWRTGRIYRTEKECEKARDRELAEVRLRRTSMFKPDFENDNGGWVVYHDPQYKVLATQELYRLGYGKFIRYKTRADAEKSIKENREDWLTYFGIEEEG